MSIFSDYRNKVNYDYIFNVQVINPELSKHIDEINDLLNNEDYLQIYFPEVGLGRVYIDVSDQKNFLFFQIGVSNIDKHNDFDSIELRKNIKDFINTLSKNLSDNEFTNIKIFILKDTESFDKKLVNENKLTFISDLTEVVSLNNEGKVEYYINNGLKESFNFSKQKINHLCESLIQEGAWLKENDNLDYNNLNDINELANNIEINNNETIQNLETAIKDIDKIQSLKNELINKVDKLVNESIEINKFPSTELTSKRLCYNDFDGVDFLVTFLNNDQIKWIENNICNRYHFVEGFKNIYYLLELDNNDHFISIDEYIDNIQYMNKLDSEKGDKENV